MRRAALLCFLLAGALLAGCTSPGDSTETPFDAATLEVVYSGQHPGGQPGFDTLVAYERGAFASAPLYAGRNVTHPGAMTVHDLMEEWRVQGGSYATNFDATYGYFVTTIEGVAGGERDDGSYFWEFKVNDVVANAGISKVTIQDGDRVTWTFTKFVA
jgi:hypothetical protein